MDGWIAAGNRDSHASVGVKVASFARVNPGSSGRQDKTKLRFASLLIQTIPKKLHDRNAFIKTRPGDPEQSQMRFVRDCSSEEAGYNKPSGRWEKCDTCFLREVPCS